MNAGFACALQLDALPVLGQAALQRGGLVGGERVGLAQFDLLGVVLVAAPDAVAADDQQRAVRLRELVEHVPAALLAAAAFHLAANHAADLQAAAGEDQAEAGELAQHVIVVRAHFSNSRRH